MLNDFLNLNKTIFPTSNPLTGKLLTLEIPPRSIIHDYDMDKSNGYIDGVINKAKNTYTEYPLPLYEYKFFNQGPGITNPADSPADPNISAFLEEYEKSQKLNLYSSIANLVGNWADIGSAHLSKDMVYGSGTLKLFNGLDALEKIPGIGNGIKLFNFGRDLATYAWSSKINKFDYDPTLSANLGNSYNFKRFDELKEMNGKRAIGSKLSRLNDERNEAKLQIDLLTDINSENQARVAMRDNVGLNLLNYNIKLNGGNNLTYIGKKGLKFELIKRAKNIKFRISTKKIKEFEDGGKFEPEIITIKPEIITNKKSVSKFQKGGKTIRSLEELITYAKELNPRFIQRLSETPRGIKFIDDEGNESNGSHYLEWSTDNEGNAVIYPRIQEMEDGSLKFLSTKEAWERANKNNNVLIMSPEEAEIFFAEDPEYTTAYKRGWPEFFNTYKLYNDENLEKIFNLKLGGTIKESDELVKLEETTQKNIIPEGALHKNKHHMEHAEGLTQKGIPVIDDDGEQQAEIELNEIIFTLEVTKKLEELHKIFKEGTNKEKDEAAIEAGKLLVQEILYNTDDRTGLISKCLKGGKLNEFK